MSDYGWIITKDHLFDNMIDDRNEAGVFGPRGINPVIEARLRNGEGLEFQMFDDDEELYYTGRYLGPNDDRMFSPLTDFGAGNAGAVTIKYKNEKEEWEVL